MMIVVKATPKARHDKVEQRADGSYAIWTTAPADKGQANTAIIKLLGKHLGVAPSQLMLRRGATSRNKMFELVE